MAVPGPLRRVFEEIVTTGNTLRELGSTDFDDHDAGGPPHDPCAVNGAAIAARRSSRSWATTARAARSSWSARAARHDENDGDGAIRVRWPEARDHPRLHRRHRALRRLGEDSRILGDVQSNPVWQILPDDMQFLMDDKRGPLLTVHPLGGCPMGDTPASGARCTLNCRKTKRCFRKARSTTWDRCSTASKPIAATAVLPGLVVLDGSIVPTSLGINPSLTIAALAWRAIEGLREGGNCSDPPAKVPEPAERPVFRVLPDPPEAPVATESQIIERMSGEALLPAIGRGTILARVELTLHSVPSPLAPMFLPDPLFEADGKPGGERRSRAPAATCR